LPPHLYCPACLQPTHFSFLFTIDSPLICTSNIALAFFQALLIIPVVGGFFYEKKKGKEKKETNIMCLQANSRAG
jgi:hypothetical protein